MFENWKMIFRKKLIRFARCTLFSVFLVEWINCDAMIGADFQFLMDDLEILWIIFVMVFFFHSTVCKNFELKNIKPSICSRFRSLNHFNMHHKNTFKFHIYQIKKLQREMRKRFEEMMKHGTWQEKRNKKHKTEM